MVEAVLKFEKGRQKILWKKQRGKITSHAHVVIDLPIRYINYSIELLAISGDSSKLKHSPN